MSDKIYAYNGEYWKVIHDFQYTGESVPFSLEPGRYLLICDGAQGGKGKEDVTLYGGRSMGILDLKETKNYYATVGGNGGNYVNTTTPGKGGYNGGGDGGWSYNSNYVCGGGGGGASDIRTIPHSIIDNRQILDSAYQELEYIETGTGRYNYIRTDYKHKVNTTVEWIGVSNPRYQSDTWEILFGARYGNNNQQFFFQVSSETKPAPSYCVGNGGIGGTASIFPYGEKIRIKTAGSSCSWYKGENLDELVQTVTAPYEMCDGCCNLILFGMANNSTSPNQYLYSYGKLYSFKIWEDEILVRHYVPCYRKYDGVIGIYDIVNKVFIQYTGGSFVRGPEINKPYPDPESLLSRLIVAGGAGGSTNISYTNSKVNYHGQGGGAVGTIADVPSADTTAYNKYPTQIDGYAFGIGMTPPRKTDNYSYGGDGAGGGGGGWFGGYAASNINASYESSNGGGGSGYVLTEDSYKPEGYLLGEEYYLTDTFMGTGLAIDPQVLVCQKTDTFNPEDIIIFPQIGKSETISLPAGKFKLKCWGGDGGVRYNINSSRRGGYAEGILEHTSRSNITVNVGSSGIGNFINAETSLKMYPTISFNGGGAPGTLGNVLSSAGGGASDIRLYPPEYFDSDEKLNGRTPEEMSLLSRFIVAGGAGGHGSAESSSNRFGGAGGGLSGNLDTSTGGRYGTSPGPGTQKASPYNSSYPSICGSFGHGGNGSSANNGFGGAGGGGWFGGCGTYPDNSGDDDNGGSGGSGYVLTTDSYKPEGYLLGEEYYLTDASLITGGNTTLPIGHSKVEIEVIECDFTKILCHDDEGYKYFNKDNNAWEYLADEIDVDLLNEYGSFGMSTDNGLLNKYELLLLDIDNRITSARLNVVPTVQKISSTIKTRLQPSRILIDAEYDRSIYDIKVVTSRTGFGSDSRVTLDVYINKKKQSIDKIKLFVASLYGKGDMNSTSKPRIVKPKIVEVQDMIERFKLTKDDVNIGDTVKEIDTDKMYTVIDIDQLNNSSGYRNKSKQYLLKVGNNDHIPIKYYQINRYINESVKALTGTLYSCLTYIHNRELYICFRRDNTVRFEKMNLISGEITWLFDKPHSTFHSGYSPGCIAVDDDYIWLTRGESYGSNANYMYRINIKTGAVSGYAPGVQIQCFGQIKFLDNHTLIWCNTNGVYMWDTNRLTLIGSYADSVTLGNCTGYFSMSNKLVLRHSYYTNAAVRIFDLETKTFSGITLSSNAVSISAYYNGKFYIAQTNKLYVFDEESRTIENTFTIPWTNPKTIDVQNGIIYLTEKNSKSLFVYDIKADMYRETYLAWTVPDESTHYQTRTSVFGGMFFLPNNTLALANYNGTIKYNLGYKMNQHMFIFDNKHESEYEYDDNFVTFDDSYAEVHDGYIHKEIVSSSIENVKSIEIDKSEYNVLKSILFDIKQNTEEGGDGNGEEVSI